MSLHFFILLFASAASLSFESRASVNSDWDSQIVYQIMVDRFFRGATAGEKPTPPPPDDKSKYQGGNLRGVSEKLDYIKDLGATALLLNPVTESEDYHGYTVMDLYKINPEFGSEKDYRALIAEAHKRGMKVLFDLVVNHMSGNSKVFKEHPDWFRDVIHPQAINDPDINEVWSKVSFFLYRDLKQEKPEVYTYLLNAAKHWIDLGIDGFRMDAVSLVQLDFWKKFNRDIKKYAPPGFMVMGELYDGDINRINHFAPDFDGLFDFPFYYAIDNAIKDKSYSNTAVLKMTLDQDGLYKNKSLRHFTFLDNQDVGRFVALTPEPIRDALLKQALAVLFTVRGVPTLLYGTEIALDNEPQFNHSEFDRSRTPMKFNKNESHPIFQFVQRLSEIRKSFDFNSRDFEFVLNGTRNGALAYILRDAHGRCRFVIHNLTGYAIPQFKLNLNYIRGLSKNQMLKNLLNPGRPIEIKDGYAYFSLAAHESDIYSP